jgi:hypothetical protein
VLLDTPGFVDQSFENAAHGVAIERMLGLAAQALEHLPFAIGIVNGDVVSALVLAHGEHDSHPFGDQFQDAAIQIVDASPQRFKLRSRLHGRDRNIRQRASQRTTVGQPERTCTFKTFPELRVVQAAPTI